MATAHHLRRRPPPQPPPYKPPPPTPPPPPPNTSAATAWPLYQLYPPGPEWPYSQHVPASQNPSKGYDLAATRISGQRRQAAKNLTNAQVQDGPSGYNLSLFVQSVGIDMRMAGSYGQSQYTRDYYPRNFVTSQVTVMGQSLTQEDYGILCEFIHSCQHKAVAHGYDNLTQLFVVGRQTAHGFQGRGYDGRRTQGTRVMIDNPSKLMQNHQSDPGRAPHGTYYSQSLRGSHQTLSAKGYITSMPRVHRQFEYAVVWSFMFTIAALLHGPFSDAAQGLPQKAPTTWLDMLHDIQKTGVVSNQTKGLVAFNNKVVKAASSTFINPLTPDTGGGGAGSGGAPQPSGQSQSGKISWFGGPNDPSAGNTTASGQPISVPGVAVDNQGTLGGYWFVTMPNGKQAVLQQTDIGPAPSTGRFMDFTYSSLAFLGYSQSNFPTDSTITAVYLGKNVPAQYKSLVITA